MRGFILKALIVGIPVALCAALLGVSLILKRYSMIGDGLSHVGFGTLAAAVAVNAAIDTLWGKMSFQIPPMMFSIPLVLLAAFLLLRINESGKIRGDAAIALISSSSLAIGIILMAKTNGMNTDILNYMFGSILAISAVDMYMSVITSIVVLLLFVVFYNRIFAVTFDESFARATGTKVGTYNMLIAFLTALVIVVGMRVMGAMLISGLIIFPALTSMRVFKSFRGVIISSGILSMICFFIGIVVSYQFSTPSSASIVVVNLAAFCLFCAVGTVKKQLMLRHG